MQLHPTLEAFYKSMLAYAGMQYDEGLIKSNTERVNDLTIDGKHLTLPYFENLKNPNNRHIFHPLNESYTSPETVFIAAYKKRLTLEINLKLALLIRCLITVGKDVAIQRKVKSPKLLAIVQGMGEIDTNLKDSESTPLEDGFNSIVKYSQKTNEEAFLVDFHVKKNAKIGETAFAAIGKVNFVLFNELQRSLDDNDKGYRVFGAKVRKQDILTLINIFHVIFSKLDDKQAYTCGTDIKSFRFLNALLLATYRVTGVINEMAELLKELKHPALEAQNMVSDVAWGDTLEELYTLTNEIRAIPSQTNVLLESVALKVNEPKQESSVRNEIPVPPSFNPSNVPMSQPVAQPQQPQQYQQPQQPQAPYAPQAPYPPQQNIQAPPRERTVEDIIKDATRQQQMYPAHNFTQQGYPQQQYPQQQYPQQMPPQQMPPQQYQQPYPQQYQQLPPQQYQQPYPPQQYQQPPPQQYQQPYPPQPGYPQQQPQPQGGISINPQLFR